MSYVIDEFLEHQRTRGLQPATIKSYKYFANGFLIPELGDRLVTDLIPQDFENLYKKMDEAGYLESTIRKCLVTARRAMKYAKRAGWVQRDVTSDVDLRRYTRSRDVTVPSASEVERLLSEARVRDRYVHDYAHTIVHTGLRPGEACGLKRQDLDGLVLTVSRSIDVSHGYARVRELPWSRRVKVDESTANILLDRGEWTFGEAEAGRTDLAAKRFRRVAVRVKLKGVTPRSLRYFHAVTLLTSNKMPLHEITNVLGYRSPEGLLRTYGPYVPSAEGAAPDIIRFALRNVE